MRTRRVHRLRLHQETLRTLSDPALAAVAGGVYAYIGPTHSDINPKSTAWTGGLGVDRAGCV